MTGYSATVLGDVAEEVNERVGKESEIPVYAVTKHAGFVLSSEYFKKRVHSANTAKYKRVHRGEFAYATIHLDEGSLGLLKDSPSAAISPMYTVFRIDESKVWQPYLFRLLKSPRMIAQYSVLGSGTVHRRKSIPFQRLAGLELHLPSVCEQKRIADTLDKTDAIRRKQQQAIDLTEDLLRSTFLELFGDPVLNPNGWPETRLDECAEVVSGVTKGRKLVGKRLKTVPYLRVANVQDGHLNLEEVKSIDVLPSDIEKYALQGGDILLTEGGDPDKLGRGAVWQGQIAPCIHQNHIFRVRVCTPNLLPDYLSALIGSSRGKRYFLRAAKQTTGIASINSGQLKSFPVLMPPIDIQYAYVAQLECIRAIVRRHECAAGLADDLFGSLSQRAFRGEL